jgi:TPR repeat protein
MGGRRSNELLRRAAEMGFAPAEGSLSLESSDPVECIKWGERAVLHGDRFGAYWLGYCYANGESCNKDTSKALELYKVAAVCGHPGAQWGVGELAFGELDWERYYRWGRAAVQGIHVGIFRDQTVLLLPSFASGQCRSPGVGRESRRGKKDAVW